MGVGNTKALLGGSRFTEAELSVSDMGLFQRIQKGSLERLASAVIRRTYRKGQRIFAQGDRGDWLYCVASGQVRIFTVGIGGKEVFLNEMNAGDCFGEIAVVDGFPRTAGAIATEPTVLLAIHRRDILRLLDEDSKLAKYLLGLVCYRLRLSTRQFEDSAFLAPSARLAKVVLTFVKRHGRQLGEEVEVTISQRDLAQFLGLSRKSVNQHLQSWKARGWVRIGRACLFIRDLDALKRLAAGLESE